MVLVSDIKLIRTDTTQRSTYLCSFSNPTVGIWFFLVEFICKMEISALVEKWRKWLRILMQKWWFLRRFSPLLKGLREVWECQNPIWIFLLSSKMVLNVKLEPNWPFYGHFTFVSTHGPLVAAGARGIDPEQAPSSGEIWKVLHC